VLHQMTSKGKYLGITISQNLSWNNHIDNVCRKANNTTAFLRRNLSSCPANIRTKCYTTGGGSIATSPLIIRYIIIAALLECVPIQVVQHCCSTAGCVVVASSKPSCSPLGITISQNLSWNNHIDNVCRKANNTTAFLRRNL
jgi:hypothetical protein